MPEQDAGTSQLQEAEKVPDMIFPPRDEAAGVVEPGEEPLDLPPAFRPAEGTPVLRGDAAAAPMARDHLDAIVRQQVGVEGIAVVPAIADQARREVGEEAGVEGGRDEVRLMR